MNARDCTHYKKKKQISRTVFTDYRNKLSNEFRKAKSTYYKEQFERNANNVKKHGKLSTALSVQKRHTLIYH